MRLDHFKVLVVDDNEHARALLTQMLRALGAYQLVEASNGHEGMAAMREHQIDIVLTDLVMAPVDGFAFVRELRTSPTSTNPQVPVIMVSGHSTLKTISAARDAGVNEFLAKPLSASGLVERLHRVLQHTKPFVRTPTYAGPDRRRRTPQRHNGPWRRAGDRPQPRAIEI
ncbi:MULTISPECIES: response regulator [Phenylobacterium]|uniref:CheY-like chemotaxis protein n=1 Tax=Phenylobacterium koreense TaxID=266125 RepID=A0ABV2EES7_9CAUL